MRQAYGHAHRRTAHGAEVRDPSPQGPAWLRQWVWHGCPRRIVAALVMTTAGLAIGIDGVARNQDGAGGLDGDAHLQILSGTDAPSTHQRCCRRSPDGERVAMLRRPGLPHSRNRPDFHALDGIDAHHGKGQNVGIEFIKQGLSTWPVGMPWATTRSRAHGITTLRPRS